MDDSSREGQYLTQEAFQRFADGRRLHVLTLVQRILKSLPALFLAFLPLVARSSETSDGFGLLFLAVYGILMLPLIVLQYLRFQYWVTPREVVIHSGILTRRKRSIPLDRIQNIEIERSLLPRLLGTAKVKIETAGSTTAEGVLEYVALAEAHSIRRVVRSYQHADATEETAATVEPADRTAAQAPSAEPARELLFALTLPRVLLSGAFRFSLLYIVLIFSALQYLMDLLGLTPDEIVDWFLRGGLRPYADIARASPVLIVAVSTALAVLVGWLTGVVINLNKYYGFRLWLTDDKLQKRGGLLTVSEGTIPLSKVQSLILRSNPLMRRYGWYQLQLQIMGYDVEKQGYQVAVPFAQKANILALAPTIRPFALPETFIPVSRLTIRRAFVRYSAVFLAALLPLAYFWPILLWGLAAWPALLLAALWHYHNHGYALSDDVLFIRRGVFRHYVWIVPLDKIQVFYTTRSLFQRRLGLASLVVDTAGAGSFSYPQIVDIPEAEGEALLQRLYDRFQARFQHRPPPPPDAALHPAP